jgi:hypothetical protein
MPENGATLMWLLYRRIFQMIVLMIVLSYDRKQDMKMKVALKR